MFRKSIIISVRRQSAKPQNDLEEFTEMINLVSRRDTNGTGLQVFRWVLENRKQMISSSKMSEVCDMNRLTCLHHIRRLEELGILDNVDGRYAMTTKSMESYIEQLECEAMERFSMLKKLARKIDDKYIIKEKRGNQEKR